MNRSFARGLPRSDALPTLVGPLQAWICIHDSCGCETENPAGQVQCRTCNRLCPALVRRYAEREHVTAIFGANEGQTRWCLGTITACNQDGTYDVELSDSNNVERGIHGSFIQPAPNPPPPRRHVRVPLDLSTWPLAGAGHSGQFRLHGRQEIINPDKTVACMSQITCTIPLPTQLLVPGELGCSHPPPVRGRGSGEEGHWSCCARGKFTENCSSMDPPRPTGPTPCEICTFINSPNRTVCEMCTSPLRR